MTRTRLANATATAFVALLMTGCAATATSTASHDQAEHSGPGLSGEISIEGEWVGAHHPGTRQGAPGAVGGGLTLPPDSPGTIGAGVHIDGNLGTVPNDDTEYDGTVGGGLTLP